MNTEYALQPEYSALVTLLDDLSAEAVHAGVPRELWQAALYRPLLDFTAHPGKELRARVTRSCYALAGGRGEVPALLPLLPELLHAGSLIVDDIEDDSAERRGRPTVHRSHGVPLALNAGNFLYFVPLALIERLPVSELTQLKMHRLISTTLLDCHRGQALDLHVKVGSVGPRELPAIVEKITALKTGRLLGMAAALGALAAEAPAPRVAELQRFGEALGRGLQMLDDLGGMTHPDRAAKGLEDLRLQRATWVWAWLSERVSDAGLRALQLHCRRAERDAASAEQLRVRVRELIEDRGRAAVRATLSEALDTLTDAVAPHPLLKELERSVATMERAYA
jgi:geranylgeranyl pyrophosphate synthase